MHFHALFQEGTFCPPYILRGFQVGNGCRLLMSAIYSINVTWPYYINIQCKIKLIHKLHIILHTPWLPYSNISVHAVINTLAYMLLSTDYSSLNSQSLLPQSYPTLFTITQTSKTHMYSWTIPTSAHQLCHLTLPRSPTIQALLGALP